eukprot:7818844-Pyramimonas_sp.AAC.1
MEGGRPPPRAGPRQPSQWTAPRSPGPSRSGAVKLWAGRLSATPSSASPCTSTSACGTVSTASGSPTSSSA